MSACPTPSITVERSALFIDGHYFYKVSNFYKFCHHVRSRISIAGLEEFARGIVNGSRGATALHAPTLDTHYFRALMTKEGMRDQYPDEIGRLRAYEDQRAVDAALRRQGVTVHTCDVSEMAEKGVDVSFTLEVIKSVERDQLTTVVLMTGDSDFIPLVQTLHKRGVRVILLGWDLCQGEAAGSTGVSTSERLRQQVDMSFRMHELIEDGLASGKPVVHRLFMKSSVLRAAA